MIQFVVNSVIERLDENLETEQLLRVLWIDEEGDQVVVMSIENNRKMEFPFINSYKSLIQEIELNRCRVTELEADMRLLSPDEDYLEKYKQNRDRIWNIIKDIVIQEPEIFISEKRGELIHQAHLNSGKSKKVIRNYLKKYWFYGKSRNGLLNNYFDCGAPGNQRVYKKKPGPVSSNRYLITEADIQNFKSAIRIFHIRQGMNLTTTHERMCETYYKRGFYRKHGVRVPIVDVDRSPSLRQFRYWYTQNTTSFNRYANNYGRRRATMDVRHMKGNASEKADYVGALFEVDATRADILLVSFDRKTILGKPVLYVVMDVFSRFVAGYHVSLASESWFESMVAVEHAGTSKVENCAQFGIHITEEDWPCHYLPKNLVGDRGELKSQLSERFVNLNVDVLNAPSYRGDLKPFIESTFHITNQTIRQLLPGSTEARQMVRGDRDPALDSALTIEEFNKFLIIYFMTYNKSALSKDYLPSKEMFTDQVELTPLKVWNWSKNKRLLHEKTRDELRYNLLPRGQAKVSRFGIEFNNLFYTCMLGIEEGWFEGESVATVGNKNIEVTFDPRNCSNIFVKHKKGLIECFLTGKSRKYENLHFDEVKKIMEYRDNQIKEQEKVEKQHRAEFHAFTEELNKVAKKSTAENTQNKSFYSRKQNKREVRTVDGKVWGAKNALTKSENKLDKEVSKNEASNVIDFLSSEEREEKDFISQRINDVQALFSRKSSERRRKDESDEQQD
ncbi:Mu transposase C-terminal domain-containing protein [Paenibacillus polymyxa]|uniref:Mu transposase C-terminal domain-containing protein n=2 Tax=Paenibacillus TaxID=44249 RepID=UPI002ED5E96D|nr:Mu transposase C-terminal domain-containing protein [Paenibacillus polymyxa]